MSGDTQLRIYESNIEEYGKIIIENGSFSIGIVPEIGGKILNLLNKNTEMFFCIHDLKYLPKDLKDKESVADFRKGYRYLPPGGYKAWLSPQDKWGWPPYMDLEAGEYEETLLETKERIEVKLKSPICRESKMQMERRIILEKINECRVIERLINCGDAAEEYGIWAVTQFKRKGKVMVICENPKHKQKQG